MLGKVRTSNRCIRGYDMQERKNPEEFFTCLAIQVIKRAGEESIRHPSFNALQVEHLLFSLIAEPESVGAKVLRRLGVNLQRLREMMLKDFLAEAREITEKEQVSFTPRTKKVIELAVDEARRRNHRFVGTIHFLFGFLQEGEGLTAAILDSEGIEMEGVNEKLHQLLDQEGVEVLLEGTVIDPVSLSDAEVDRLIRGE